MADQQYFFKNEDIEFEHLDDLIKRKIVARGGDMMIVEMTFKKGGIGKLHDHFHEQVSYCISGKIEFTVNGETTIIGPGDSVYMPPDSVHGAKVLEDAVLLDIFTPQREDFLQPKN